ncbi:ferric reductase NAD binding domain-containing protein [Aspergillus unguis]
MGIDYHDPSEQRLRGVHPPMNVALATPLFVLGGAFIALFFLRLITTIQHRRRRRAVLKSKDQLRYTRESSAMAWLKKHVLYAPLFSTRHSREFRLLDQHMGTVPLRVETLLIGGYLAVNIAFFFSLVDWWQDYQELLYQLKYAAGHLAVMNLPGLLIAVGRNNPLIQMLGIQFDGFNLLHRWVGRLVVVAAIVHVACVAVGHIAQSGVEQTAHIFWHVPFFIYGMVAFIAFLLLLIHSVSPLRHAFYEFFLACHQFLAIAAFVGLWYHLRNLAQQNVLLATIVIWGLERTSRLVSIVWNNCSKQRTTADVTLLPSEDGVRVDVTLARNWKFKAGQYMYLYNPLIGLWTSHPFSVAWTSACEPDADADGDADAEKYDSSDSLNSFVKEHPTKLSLLVKGKEGFTGSLTRKAKRSEGRRFQTTVFAEGPYGGLHSLSSYGSVLLIAGGIGITHSMSYMHEFLDGFVAGSIAARRVNLVWVLKKSGDLSWVDDWMRSIFEHSAVQNKEGRLDVSIQVYITADELSEEATGVDVWVYKHPLRMDVTVHEGRPCFGTILTEEKARQVGAMAVSVCGPGSMGDAVREAVRKNQDTKKVDLYEEAFSW